MPTHPEVLWAQRSSKDEESKNVVFLTVNLPNIIENTLEFNLTSTSISFKAKAGDSAKGIEEKEYEFKLDFFEEVIPEKSKKNVSSRHFALILQKKEKKLEFWTRLTKEKQKLTYVKTDFGKWVDEDEQEGEPIKEEEFDPLTGMGGGDFGGMGPPGMSNINFEQMMADMQKDKEAAGATADNDDDEDDGPPPLESLDD